MTKRLLGIQHIAIEVQDLETTVQWYKDLLGLAEVERRADRVYLAAGNVPSFDLCFIDGTPSLRYVSILAHDGSVVQQFADRVEAAGVTVGALTDLDPGVTGGIAFPLPSGQEMRIVTIADEQRQKYTWGGKRYFGALRGPKELNHITISAVDVDAAEEFMVGQLDFRVSDRVKLPDETPFFSFLRAGSNHHDVAVVHADRDGVDHIAFVVRDVGELASCADRLAAMGGDLEWGPGRHTPGDAMFLYVRDPGGHRLEISTDFARILDEDVAPGMFVMGPSIGSVWNSSTGIPPESFMAFVA